MAGCPFCRRIATAGEGPSSAHSVAFPDAFPVSPGHRLVVPRRHVASALALSLEEWHDLWQLVREVAAGLDADGCNIGVNLGEAAGQTIEHAHVHVIPRAAGDHPDPRGGVRWVLPDTAPYWS